MHPDLFTIPGINLTVPSYGAMVMIGFLLATWWMAHRSQKVKVNPDIALNIGFLVLIFSTLGARTFYVIHYWDAQFADNPGQIINLRAGGMEFYGGFIGAFLACALYIWLKGLSVRLFADLVAPSLLLAMGIGRIGCFLFGCCWGGPCSDSLPWAVHFPFSSPPHQHEWEARRAPVPARAIFIDASGVSGPVPRGILKKSRADLEKVLTRTDDMLKKAEDSGDEKRITQARKQREEIIAAVTALIDHFDAYGITIEQLREEVQGPVFRTRSLHPAQLYAATGPILLAFLTSAYFYRRKRHGSVMLVGFALYAVERFIEEIIRIDNPQDTFGLTVSQGISIVIFVICMLGLLLLRKLPPRSSKMEPWYPPAS